MAAAHGNLVSRSGQRIIGVRYTFPFDVYPRYSYLQSWTARLVPRFRNKIETNRFQECVCDGYKGLEEISAAEKCLQRPTVTIFSKEKSFITGLQKSLVATFEPFKYEKLDSSSMAWNDMISEGNGSCDYDSRVLIVIAKDTDHDLFEKLSQLSKVQQESTLIYNPSSNTQRFHKKKSDSGLEAMNTSKALSQDIQALLELKVVTLLEKIAIYMEPLVPREGPEPDKSFLDHITDQFKQFEICCVKEILGEDKYSAKDTQGRTLEVDEPSRKRKKAVNKRQEYSSHSVEKMPGNKRRKKAVNETPDAKKNPADKFLSMHLKSKTQIKDLIDLIGRRTKCQMIDHLSMEYGIHPMILTSFLCNEKFFNFYSHYDSWISKYEIDQGVTAATILKKCETTVRPLLDDIVDYVSGMIEQLEGIQKQQFELFGILRQSGFNVKVKLETKLNPELQDEILCLPEVTGCGTIFGVLTLHASTELTQSTKDNLKHLLRKYNYHRRHRVSVVSSRNDQAGSALDIDGGSGLMAEFRDSHKKKQGTLGCFVVVQKKAAQADEESIPENLSKLALDVDSSPLINNIKGQVFFRNEDSAQGASEGGQSLYESSVMEELEQISNTYGLHCITCQHCVSGCQNVVETVYGQGRFAVQTPYFIESGDKFDIALLSICEGRKNECKRKLPGKRHLNSESYLRYPWRIFDNSSNLAARPVYKYGHISKDTYGVIASDNYKQVHKLSATLQQDKPLQYADQERCMHPTVNLIIIGSESEFSKDGDSGAVICDQNINDNVVTAISILHGEMVQGEEWKCTYSARLRESIDELKRRFHIEIDSPNFDSSMEIEDPFPPLPDLSDEPQSPVGDGDELMAPQGDMGQIADQERSEEKIYSRAENKGKEEVDKQEFKMKAEEGASVAKKCKTDKIHFKSNGLFLNAVDISTVSIQGRQQNLRQCQILPLKSSK